MIRKVDGKQLKLKRKLRGHTRRSLARKLGVDVEKVRAWERNQKNPSKTEIRRIVKVLDIIDLELRHQPVRGRGKGETISFYG
jgi:transcriptional regulator with XRE-family HTH domain